MTVPTLDFEFNEHLDAEAPEVLLPYQQRWVADTSQVKIADKSRRVGLTWAEASDDVLVAATDGRDGMDVFYIGYNQEMTREYIDTCAWWVKHFGEVAGDVEELFVKDEDKDTLAYRINFASGHEILALTSRPSNLRGRQGRVVVDEAAFHGELEELIKAAMALLMWGGDVRIISTHDGEDNHFNQLIQDARAGRLPYSVHRITLDDALDEGLYQRICLIRGSEWSMDAQTEWREKLIISYGDGADEELFCVPSKAGGAYLVRTTIEGCMNEAIPVIRWEPPAKDFVDWPDDIREDEMEDWLDENIGPLMVSLPLWPSYFGEDFARTLDLTCIWPMQLKSGKTHTPFIVELRDCPFSQQEQTLFYIGERLPRLSGGALDKGGNGAFLAERARQKWGPEIIDEVSFHETWNLENWPPAKAALEDRTTSLPKDDDVLDDFRAVKKVKGVPKVPRDSRNKDRKDKGKRHGDSAIAYVLAQSAVRKFEPEDDDWDPITSGTSRAAGIMRGY